MSALPCPNATLWKRSCKRRSCPVCGARWARDWQRVFGVNLEAVGARVATIAVTAPGADRLPWDEHYCTMVLGRRPGHKHEGRRGCRCEQRPLREWSETLSWRWAKLRQAARLATKRELSGAAPAWVVARVWEPQKRGAPHLHLVVPFETALDKRAAWVFLKHLKRLAPMYDFGKVGRERGKGPELQPIEGREAARYLANYLAGRTSKKTSIRENIADPNLPRSLCWLTPRLTRETFCTMRTLRRARHLWAAWDGLCPPPAWSTMTEAVKVAVVFRTIYPARAGPPVNVAEALSWAASLERRLSRELRVVWSDEQREYVPNEPLFRDLTYQALAATHDRGWRRAAAAA